MKIGPILQHPAPTYEYEADSVNWIAPRLRIGLEIEIENPKGIGYKMEPLYPWWGHHPDGSLRDNGFELVLSEPMFGKDLTNAINVAETFLVTNYPNLVLNYRTGLHVHVDSRNLELAELKRFFILYALFERSIFNFVGDARNNNNFCVPWARVSDHLEQVFGVFEEGTSNDEIRNIFRNTERYSALNCNSLVKYGSLEFRHMQMSRDFNKIRRWINLVMSIYTAALAGSSYGPQVPIENFIQEAAKGGAIGIATRIFPEWFLPDITDRAIWEGIMLVQDVSIDMIKNFKFQKGFSSDYPKVNTPNRGYQEFIRKMKEQK